jgi:hypothetical protein
MAGCVGECCEVFKKAELYMDMAFKAGSGLIGDLFIVGAFKAF